MGGQAEEEGWEESAPGRDCRGGGKKGGAGGDRSREGLEGVQGRGRGRGREEAKRWVPGLFPKLLGGHANSH